MFATKFKSVLTVVLVLAALAGGAGLLYQTQAGEQPMAKEEQPAVKSEQKVLTPEEAVKQKPTEKVTVKFKVTAAETMRVSKSNVIYENVGFNEVLILKDGDSFCVQLLPPVMDTIRRLGIEPDKHFKGTVVQVTGRLGPGQPAFGTGQFQIVVSDLTQFEVVGE